MGAPVCANLVRAGHRVSAFDVRPELSRVALDAGASPEVSATSAAAGAEALVTVLPGPAEVAAALDDAVFEALAPDAVWIDMTSNTAVAAGPIRDRARAHGVEVLEAPLGGGPDDAREARLRLFVGGDPEVVARCRPLLEALAPADRIAHVGGHDAGYTTKLLVNALWFGQAAATAEALLLGRRVGIDPAVLRDALAGSAAASDFIRHDLEALFEGDYLRSYPLHRIHDQLAAVADAASLLGTPHEITDAVLRLHRRALERYGPVDGELLPVALLEEESGITLRW
ncbi:3-hydroxyisobutyrate dehydrogenase [Streptomyces sp. TS71-3]|nr:3-hydroxyisobutyrate dehydrogenase [Streptomyces sp. TS71-3]